MDDQISIQETESEIKVIVNGSEFMTFEKSKFPDRQSTIDFATDIIALFNIGIATGEAVGLVNFINSLTDGDYSKDELKSRARHTIASKYGEAIDLTFD